MIAGCFLTPIMIIVALYRYVLQNAVVMTFYHHFEGQLAE